MPRQGWPRAYQTGPVLIPDPTKEFLNLLLMSFAITPWKTENWEIRSSFYSQGSIPVSLTSAQR